MVDARRYRLMPGVTDLFSLLAALRRLEGEYEYMYGIALGLRVALASTLLVGGGPVHADVGPRPSPPAPRIVKPAAPAPTPVPVACGWVVVGHASNCDDLNPNAIFSSTAWPSGCSTNNNLIANTVESATMTDGSTILLAYDGSPCRTVAASLYAPHYTGSGPCTVTITRSSDGATTSTQVAEANGFWSAESYSLYDAGVSVVASAS
jgi:hypothetical protein